MMTLREIVISLDQVKSLIEVKIVKTTTNMSVQIKGKIKMCKMNLKVHPSRIIARSNQTSKSKQKIKKTQKNQKNKKSLDNQLLGSTTTSDQLRPTKKYIKIKNNKKSTKNKTKKKYKKQKSQKIKGITKGVLLLCLCLLSQTILPDNDLIPEKIKNKKNNKN